LSVATGLDSSIRIAKASLGGAIRGGIRGAAALRCASGLLEAAPLLVVAPHPDDETLTCGGLIARRSAEGKPTHVVVVTDGALGGRFGRRADTVPGRQQELFRALGRLGVPAEQISTLGFDDGGLHEERGRLERALAELLDDTSPSAVAFTSAWDPHLDHAAVGEVMRSLARCRAITAYETVVWGWVYVAEAARCVKESRSEWYAVLRWLLAESVDVAAYLDVKRSAIGEYQSQLQPSAALVGVPFRQDQPHLVDHGGGVGRGLLQQFLRPKEIYFRAPST